MKARRANLWRAEASFSNSLALPPLDLGPAPCGKALGADEMAGDWRAATSHPLLQGVPDRVRRALLWDWRSTSCAVRALPAVQTRHCAACAGHPPLPLPRTLVGPPTTVAPICRAKIRPERAGILFERILAGSFLSLEPRRMSCHTVPAADRQRHIRCIPSTYVVVVSRELHSQPRN